MKIKITEKYVYDLFELTLALKVFNAIWEIALALVILLDRDIKDSIFSFTVRQIRRHPHDFISPYIQRLLPHISHGTEIFIAIYLLAQGLIKIFLIIGLYKKKLWVYPVAMYTYFFFIIYQLYRYLHTHGHSPFLIIVSLLDVATILLIEHEYKRLKKEHVTL